MENAPSSSPSPSPKKSSGDLGKAARRIALGVVLGAAALNPSPAAAEENRGSEVIQDDAKLTEDLSAVKKDGCSNYPRAAALLKSDVARFDQMYRAAWQEQTISTDERRWRAVSSMDDKLKKP